VINPAVDALAPLIGTATACALLGSSRASHYRAKQPPMLGPKPCRPAAANALTDIERAQVLAVLTSDRFVDKSVAQTWATLLDEGTYLCSMSSMHRILRANHAAGERRSQATHPARAIPELLATKPGQVWSWDITKLRGPQRGVYFDLYVVLDIFSRYVVGYYNHEHRHAGIGLHAPASVHHGTHHHVRALRQQTLNSAYAAHPERFGHRRPEPPRVPTEAWINQPSREALVQSA
jgi:hypothetical protein